ncbi:outer membrane protein [Roseiterribacter gracilis]|uniref:Membrane protein n=1 Tax=Roseiterribacter gracilis TaxID=2812848 RepID=A0A8S8X922_9PROT|nr:membrane protein [Rhodospirillales bacterium TMPK1]
MRILFALPLLSAALLSNAAHAQQAASTSPSFNWSGFHAGINAGFGTSDKEDIVTTGVLAGNIAQIAANRRPGLVTNSRDGFLGGAQIGYDWQVGKFVYGVEADLDITDLDHTTSFISTLNDRTDFKQKQTSFGTVRARAGYAVGNFLPYVTAGWAFGRYSNSVNLISNAAPNPVTFSGSQSGLGTGWTAGAGIDYALAGTTAFGNPVSLRAEYLYYDLGGRNVNVPGVPGLGNGGYVSRFDNTGHVLRVGLNFKFGGPAASSSY